MRRAARSFATLIVLFSAVSLGGCGGKQAPETVRPLEVTGRFDECVRPDRPEPPVLNESLHVGHIDVLKPLMEAVDLQGEYADLLEAALDCYEQRRMTEK